MQNLLSDHLRIAAAAVAALKQGVLPVRRPSWNAPDLWAKTITMTKMETVAGGMVDFEDFLVFKASKEYSGRIDQYIMDTYTDISSTGVQFRIRRDASVWLTNLDQVEKHKEASDEWPLHPRDLFLTVSDSELITIQVFNPDVAAHLIFAAFYGWQYVDYSPTRGDYKEGIYDVRTVT